MQAAGSDGSSVAPGGRALLAALDERRRTRGGGLDAHVRAARHPLELPPCSRLLVYRESLDEDLFEEVVGERPDTTGRRYVRQVGEPRTLGLDVGECACASSTNRDFVPAQASTGPSLHEAHVLRPASANGVLGRTAVLRGGNAGTLRLLSQGQFRGKLGQCALGCCVCTGCSHVARQQ